ncbi:hypothetical protein QJS66_04105 [Kocuria rhizophila]|nr:hypothetical protein QJS66_04105 [Kocuria rhizophila]
MATGIGVLDTLAHVAPRPSPCPSSATSAPPACARRFPAMRDDAAVCGRRRLLGRSRGRRPPDPGPRAHGPALRGPRAANRAAARDLIRDDSGRVVGPTSRTSPQGETREVRAKVVISAAGVDEPVQDLAESETGLKVLASKGIHIVVPEEHLEQLAPASSCGGEVRLSSSVGRLVIGARIPYGGLASPTGHARGRPYVLDHARQDPRDPLTMDDVIGASAGCAAACSRHQGRGPRPRPRSPASTRSVVEAAPGLFTITRRQAALPRDGQGRRGRGPGQEEPPRRTRPCTSASRCLGAQASPG